MMNFCYDMTAKENTTSLNESDMTDKKFKIIRYGKGSFPIVEGDKDANLFYIIRQGKVRVNSSTFSFDNQQTQELGPGDFFGVISCMAQRDRLETAEILTDTSLIVIQRDELDSLIKKNVPIAMKIIRYFSKQLRSFNSVLTQLSFRHIADEHPSHLFDMGEYYSTHRINFSYAAYAYMRYIQSCPNGELVTMAKSKLAKILNRHNDSLKLEPQKDGYNLIYGYDQLIFLENEPGNALFIIKEGEVRILKLVKDHEVLLSILKSGDIFGEMAILENRPRNATAIAASDVKLMRVSKDNFQQVVEAHPEIGSRIIKLLSDRIWFIQRHISNILIKDPETRIYDAMYIHLLKDRVNIRAGGGHTFDMNYKDLLQFTGLDNPKGEGAMGNIRINNKSISLIKGKIVCSDITSIEKYMNVIQRNVDIKQPR